MDAAFKDGMAAVGWVEKDWEGAVTDTGAMKIRCSLALVAKATAMLVALEAARKRRRSMVLMEGDNQGVIKSIIGKAVLPWEPEVLASNVRLMANGVPRWMLSSGQCTLALRQSILVSLLADRDGE